MADKPTQAPKIVHWRGYMDSLAAWSALVVLPEHTST